MKKLLILALTASFAPAALHSQETENPRKKRPAEPSGERVRPEAAQPSEEKEKGKGRVAPPAPGVPAPANPNANANAAKRKSEVESQPRPAAAPRPQPANPQAPRPMAPNAAAGQEARERPERPANPQAPRPMTPNTTAGQEARERPERPANPQAPRPMAPNAAAGQEPRKRPDAAPNNRPRPNPPTATTPARPAANEARAKGNPNAPAPRPAAQDPAVRAAVEKARNDRAQARSRASAETNRALADRNENRDRAREAELARKIDNDDDANTLVYAILGGAAAGAITGNLASRDNDPRYVDGRYHRLPPEQVGRDPRDREQSVDFLSRRFRGGAEWNEAPASWHRHSSYEGPGYRHQPHYFNGNRRVVYYQSYQSIPPILLASQRLDRLEVATLADSPYRLDSAEPEYYQNLPEAYRQDDSYAVSYEVDPESAVILDDILFEQGSAAFADAYSYDLVADLASAMNSSEVASDRFVIEGHASTEGDYNANLSLSQERAERIARDLVSMGVSADRLVPVGYGETEARFPETSVEEERSLDRRVMVFRMNE